MNGAAIDRMDKHGRTPLHIATRNMFCYISSYLIDKGADLDQKDTNGQTALHMACMDNQIDRGERLDPVHYLLRKGANLEAKDINGRTALHYASMYDNSKLIRCLLDKGARPDVKDNDGKLPMDVFCQATSICTNLGYRSLINQLLQMAMEKLKKAKRL